MKCSLGISNLLEEIISPSHSVVFLHIFPLIAAAATSLQSCPTLCDPMDYSPPGFAVHGNSPGKNTGVGFHALLQGSSQPRDLTEAEDIKKRWQDYTEELYKKRSSRPR